MVENDRKECWNIIFDHVVFSLYFDIFRSTIYFESLVFEENL